MKIESTNSLRTDFWPSYDEIDELNQRVNNVENEVDLLNINVISNDTEIRERISSLQNSYNEQIKTEKLIANQIDVNYASTDFLNSGNINSNNVYIEYLTVNRPVHDAVFNTVHLENATSLNGNFYSPNLIDAHISGNAEINANNINADVVNINYASIDYLKVNLNVEPINSSAVLGYDSDGHLIPIHATYDVGFPSDANYIFTDSFGTAFPGVAADTVAPVNNLIQASAVQNMYNDINNGFNTVANTFNDVNNAISDGFNTVANTFNDINNGFNTVNDTFNDVNNTVEVLNNNITETNNTLKDLIENYLTIDTSGFINSTAPINIQTATEVAISRFIPASSDSTDIGNGAAMKMDGTKLTIYIPGAFWSQENCSNMFNNCTNLNQNIQIPKGAVNCANMFYFCNNLNQNIAIPNSVTDCSYMFSMCTNLNQNIAIPNSVINVSSMFTSCVNFNQNIAIPEGVEDCSDMFGYCWQFNQNIAIPNSVKNCRDMFEKCQTLNQNILIPNSVISTEGMFAGYDSYGCTNLNQNILIPNSVINANYMFDNCVNLNQNIYVYSENIGTNCFRMFNNCDLLADKYIHIRSSISLDTSNEFYNCLVNRSTGVNFSGNVINDLEEPTVWPPL